MTTGLLDFGQIRGEDGRASVAREVTHLGIDNDGLARSTGHSKQRLKQARCADALVVVRAYQAIHVCQQGLHALQRLRDQVGSQWCLTFLIEA
jgi:hypothetical protein